MHTTDCQALCCSEWFPDRLKSGLGSLNFISRYLLQVKAGWHVPRLEGLKVETMSDSKLGLLQDEPNAQTISKKLTLLNSQLQAQEKM